MITAVYRNLNTGLWSIKQGESISKLRVVAHAEMVCLAGVTVKQSEARRQAVIKSGHREVHCMAMGTLIAIDGWVPFADRTVTVNRDAWPKPITPLRHVTYNPTEHTTLTYADTGEEFTSARYAEFTDKMYAR